MKKIILPIIGIIYASFSFSQELDTLSSINLEEVVVSANKWEQNVKEIPSHIVVIKSDKIEFQNPQTGADLLSASGQVFVQKSQMGGGSPMIRGFATNRVLLVVDGVRLNNAIFRAGNIQNAILMDASNIEASEIIFGPGSVTYGSDAIGGVMDFHTLNPKFSHTDQLHVNGSALLRWSSANMEKTGHVHFNVATKKWASMTSFTYSDFGDLRMGSHGPDEYLKPFYVERIDGKDSAFVNSDSKLQKFTNYSQYNLLQKLRFKVTPYLELKYALHLTQSSNIPRYDRLIELKNGKPKSAEWYYGPQNWMMNTIQIKYSKQNILFDYANITLAHQNYTESRHDRKFNSSSLRHKTENVQALSGNFDFSKVINEKANLYYGIDLIFNTVHSTAEIENISNSKVEPTASRYPDGSTWNSYAVYATYKHSLTKKVIAQAGLRYNLVNMKATFDHTFYPFPFDKTETKNGALTGTIGLVYNPNDKLMFNANFGTGFRSPNIDDMGKLFDSEPGAVIVPNPELKPEYAYNYELGVTKILSHLFKANCGAFYTILEDAQVRRDYQFNGQDSIMYDGTLSKVQTIQNAAKAHVYGFFVGAEMKLENGLGLSLNYNYQKGDEELDDGTVSPLRHAAPWFGDIHISYTRKSFKLDLYTNAMGEIAYEDLPVSEQGKPQLYAIDSNGNPYCPSWYTLNFKANFKIKEKLILMAGVENITDQRYRSYSSGIVSPGLNVITAIRFNF